MATASGGTRPTALPGRFPFRLMVAFALVAGVAAGVLAAVTVTVASASRMAGFEDRAGQQAGLTTSMVASNTPVAVADLVSAATRDPGLEVMAVSPGGTLRSRPDLEIGAVPAAIRHPPAGAPPLKAFTKLGRYPYLVIATAVPEGHTLFLFFSESEVLRNLAALRLVLAAGWLLVVVAAAALGRAAGKRTLLPMLAAEAGLCSTLDALQAAHDRERAFSATVAHELRTPLSAVVGAAGLLGDEQGGLPQELRRPAQILVEGVDRLQRLVGDLLELSRMDAGQVTTRCEPLALDRVVTGALRLGGWESQVQVDLTPVDVLSDGRRLEGIVVNLVSNAVKHGQGAAVRSWLDGGRCMLEISDAGPGIPPEDLPRIFDRFYTGGRSRCPQSSGLGLAIAQEYARLIGTSIEVDSRLGEGSRFTLRLPCARPPSEDPPPGEAPPTGRPVGLHRPPAGTCLLGAGGGGGLDHGAT